MRRTLLNFSITSLDDIEQKGNMQYVQHYLTHFDAYVGVYVWGSRQRVLEFGETAFVCVGTGHGARDLLFSPWRVYKVARDRGATHFLTADLIYGWWHALLLRLFLKAKIVSMPVCTPPEIIKNSGQTYSGFPVWLERLLITLTFMLSKRIIVASNSFATQRWLLQLWCRNKVCVVAATPEELPSVDFLRRLKTIEEAQADTARQSGGKFRLAYVGRLEPEKLVGDLIEVAQQLKSEGREFELTLIGGGTEQESLKKRAHDAGLFENIKFRGFLSATEVAEELSQTDIFVSTLTGTALKEAAFSRVATVAYAIDYVPDLLTDRENCLLARGGDPGHMARQILELMDDPDLRHKIADNLYSFALARWSPGIAGTGLKEAFGDL